MSFSEGLERMTRGEYHEASHLLQQRILRGGDDLEEIYTAMVKRSLCLYQVNNRQEADAESLRAFQLFPLRTEVLYHACRWHRCAGSNAEAYRFFQLAARVPEPEPSPSTCCNPQAWEWAYELSIIAYYVVGKAGLKPIMQTLHRSKNLNIPPDQLKNVLTNLEFYMEPLDFPKTDLAVPHVPTFNSMTPHIASLPGVDGIITLVRYVDYTIHSLQAGHFSIASDGLSRSISTLKVGDGPWRRVTVSDGSFSKDLRPQYKGIEDIRLFSDPKTGKIKGLGTVYEYSQDQKGTIAVLDVDLSSATITIDKLIPRRQDCEKNHSPILGTNSVVYSWGPVIRIYDLDNPRAFTHEQTDVPIIFRGMRGSSPGVAYPSKGGLTESYWFITHTKSDWAPWGFFSYIVVLSATSFKLKAYTVPFLFESRQIEFATGFAFVEDDSSILIGYSTMDRSSKTIKVPVSHFLQMMIDV